FFFQAEDGIRDKLVTGVQTCALPICARARHRFRNSATRDSGTPIADGMESWSAQPPLPSRRALPRVAREGARPGGASPLELEDRSEERRVGKECRARGSPERGEPDAS